MRIVLPSFGEEWRSSAQARLWLLGLLFGLFGLSGLVGAALFLNVFALAGGLLWLSSGGLLFWLGKTLPGATATMRERWLALAKISGAVACIAVSGLVGMLADASERKIDPDAPRYVVAQHEYITVGDREFWVDIVDDEVEMTIWDITAGTRQPPIRLAKGGGYTITGWGRVAIVEIEPDQVTFAREPSLTR